MIEFIEEFVFHLVKDPNNLIYFIVDFLRGNY